MCDKGFDNELYIKKQKEQILKRIDQFGGKLYLEFGGKLFDDCHAARVLPGFDVNAKIKLLKELKDETEIIFCINAGDMEKSKIRADFGITYDVDVMRLIDNITAMGLKVNSVVITQYKGQVLADVFRNVLEMRGIKTYTHKHTKGYPSDIDTIVSDEGYGVNSYIETTMPLVVVNAPGPGSGKLATCLSQLYHEHKRGNSVGYAKFETFPIWNIPLKHPVNLAYEAATADLKDVNMIDPFHLDYYDKTTVNYNRDIEVFPVLKTILRKILGEDIYHSPTDMGVNMAGYGIVDDDIVREAAKQEILRRYYRAWCDHKKGLVDIETPQRIEMVMRQIDIVPTDRKVVGPALEKEKIADAPAVAIQIDKDKVVTGRASKFINAASSAVLNSIKEMAGIDDDTLLISPLAIEPILKLKKDLGSKNPELNLEETLIALSMCVSTDPTVELAMKKLNCLEGKEIHSTVILSQADETMFRKLGVNLSCEPKFASSDLYDS